MTFAPDEHQLRAVREFCRGSYVLVWDPGVGKTWPCIAAAARTGGNTLCIVPAHLRDQWHDKVLQFEPEQLSPYVLEGTREAINKKVFDNYNFLICSYEYVATEARWKQLRGRKWENIILDEVHYLIRPTAQRTQAILGKTPESRGALVRAARAVWPLSGTPFTYPDEIFPLLAQVFPETTRREFGNRYSPFMSAKEWEIKFCRGEHTGFGWKIVGVQNIEELRERLAGVLDKVRLSEVHHNGNVTDTIPIRGKLTDIMRGLDPELLGQYEVLESIVHDPDIPDDEKLDALEDSGLDMAQLRHNIAVAKLQPTAEMVRFELETYPHDKICVYGWHREPLKALAKTLKAPAIIGGMPKSAKKDAIARFVGDPNCRVLLGQIGAIGTGTDGLQEAARRGIIYEPSWSHRDNVQVLHRLFRRGQERDCYHSFLSLHGSLDEYVARVLKRKASDIARALD